MSSPEVKALAAGRAPNASATPWPAFVLLSLACAAGAAGLAAWLGGGAAAALALAVLGATVALAGRALPRHHPHDRFGAANAVTLARAGAMAALAGLLAAPAPDAATAWAATALALAALALDGVDGWAARRSGLASDFGARFDMETDAALGLVLALLALHWDKAGVWVLGLGLMRYAFVAAMPVFPWLANPLAPRYGRKVACVVQIAALTALLAPIVVPPVSTLVAAGALAILAWSFATDIRALARA